MNYLTPEELCMIEMLTYFNEASDDIYNAVSMVESKRLKFDKTGLTVSQILSAFDKDKIALLKGNDSIIDTSFFISGKEWGQIIEYILSNEKISSLVYRGSLDSGSTKLGLCFTDDEPNSQEAIVAFLGTANNEEWLDDVRAAVMEDSPCQEEALNYIDNLPYSDITVIGHSKGGNKAMYTAILSEKVTRCVSFDGQGFSREFMAKYSGRISDRAEIITNYSLSTDFVHILLNQIPGSDQYYCKGYGITSPGTDLDDMLSVIGQNHSPNSFFKTDDSGIVTDFDLDGNDIPVFEFCDEPESIINLKNFVNYIFDISDKSASEALMWYVEKVMSAALNGDDIPDVVFSDTNQLGTLLGYTFNFIDSNSLDKYDTRNLLAALGLYQFDIVKIISGLLFNTSIGKALTGVTEGVIKFISLQFKDGKDDYLLKQIIWDFGKKHISKELDQFEFYNLWDKMEEKFNHARNGEKSYFDEDSGIIDDILSFMTTDRFNAIIKNESDMDVIVNAFKDYSLNNNDIFSLTHVLFITILDKYGYTIKIGDDNDDYLMGPNKNCLSFLGNGDDIFFGGRYDDVIIGGTGKDSIAGGQGNDVIYGGNGNDSLYGNDGDDTIYGENDDDTIVGGEGNDIIDGGSGNDWIYGYEGNDTIIAGSGTDHVWGDAGDDEIHGSSGHNYLFGGKDNDIITGGIETDNIWGGDDNDTLDGSFGNDSIYGGNGSDTLDGGYGTDYLYGGNDGDTYIVTKDRNQNYIFDTYGNNFIYCKDIILDELDFVLSDTIEGALDIKIKDTNDVFTIMKFNESYERYYLDLRLCEIISVNSKNCDKNDFIGATEKRSLRFFYSIQ